jgi:hypothetical protein
LIPAKCARYCRLLTRIRSSLVKVLRKSCRFPNEKRPGVSASGRRVITLLLRFSAGWVGGCSCVSILHLRLYNSVSLSLVLTGS